MADADTVEPTDLCGQTTLVWNAPRLTGSCTWRRVFLPVSDEVWLSVASL